MKNPTSLLLAGVLLCVPLYGCAQTSSQTQTEEQTQTDKRYDEIIADLEEENYDGAIDAITEMKKEAQAKAHADMEKYLVTVELTPENFDEYFEWVTPPHINAFGEQEFLDRGLRSKKYDDGLILYDLDDGEYCDAINFRYTCTLIPATTDNNDKITEDEITEQCEASLTGLLRMSWSGTCGKTLTIDSIDQMVGSKLTYIKKDFVESYEIEPAEHPDNPEESRDASVTITLKNGETFDRYIARDYPY